MTRTGSRWQQVTDLIAESFIQLIRLNSWFIQDEAADYLCE